MVDLVAVGRMKYIITLFVALFCMSSCSSNIIPIPILWHCLSLDDDNGAVVLHLDDTDRVTIFTRTGQIITRDDIKDYGDFIYGFDSTTEKYTSIRFGPLQQDVLALLTIDRDTRKEEKFICR